MRQCLFCIDYRKVFKQERGRAPAPGSSLARFASWGFIILNGLLFEKGESEAHYPSVKFWLNADCPPGCAKRPRRLGGARGGGRLCARRTAAPLTFEPGSPEEARPRTRVRGSARPSRDCGAGRRAAAEAHLCPAALRLLFAQTLASGREEEGKGEKGLNPARGDQKSAGTAAGGVWGG